MMTDRLSDHQKRTYTDLDLTGYSYGLGVRCPKGDKRYTDFGWAGTACSYLAIDMENEISVFLGVHLLSSPAQNFISMLGRFARAELVDGEFESIRKDLKEIFNYTY